jgi:hypothetical protein
MTDTCSNCRFHHSIPWTSETGQGIDHFCRFDPPQFVPPINGHLLPVRADGWCGKWQKGKLQPAKVPAPGSDPNTERSPNLSVRAKRKKGVAAII